MKHIEELIRGEYSAVKSIDLVLRRVKNNSEIDKLYEIRNDHFRAINRLKPFAKSDFDKKTLSYGPWGLLSTAFTGGASFFGDKAALRALKFGEEHGVSDYKEAINDKNISSELKQIIQNELLPAQERHLQTINSYLK